MNEHEHEITEKMAGMNADPGQRQAVMGLVYDDLLRIARAELARHRRGETLNTRALVNECYLKLFDRDGADFENRKHFFATAARAMRQVVIDYARSRLADRRGAGAEHLALDQLEGVPLPVDEQAEQLVGMDKALEKLAGLDERLVTVVELRFFAGLEVKDIAELLGVSEPTIKRDTRAAKAFLQKELGGG
ncbi:ECF-type sigma factor [Tahibacter soli]|uniref:ECF-type sigma factor n=1 Tax=Tahibacter soli TaxID=2983605 RepID=A0A9X3YPB3_9GAMM|nr:ECF-type sigma factor [Tahibacter soli]MDC8014341.1 ECF-type sigma factor [Tahibacter soli]